MAIFPTSYLFDHYQITQSYYFAKNESVPWQTHACANRVRKILGLSITMYTRLRNINRQKVPQRSNETLGHPS